MRNEAYEEILADRNNNCNTVKGDGDPKTVDYINANIVIIYLF